MSFKKGDKVKIICNISQHIFKIGEIVKVKMIGEFMGDIYAYIVYKLDNKDWEGCVYKEEIEKL